MFRLKFNLAGPVYKKLLLRQSHLETPLWQVFKKIPFGYLSFLKSRFMKRVYWITLGLILVYTGLVSIGAVAIYKKGIENSYTKFCEKIFPYPAAYINKEIVPLSRFRIEVESRETWAVTHTQDTPKAEIQQFVAKQLAVRTLYMQAMTQNKITFSEEDYQKQLADSYDQMGGKDKLAQFLNDNYGPNATIELYETWMREKVTQEVVQQTLLEQITLKHILISVAENASDADKEAARQRALKVKEELTDLAKFAEVAAKYSNDLSSKDNGGQLGTTYRGDDAPILSADFEAKAFALPVGQVSDPIFSSNGWHLIVVEAKSGSIPLSRKAYTDKLWQDARIKLLIGA